MRSLQIRVLFDLAPTCPVLTQLLFLCPSFTLKVRLTFTECPRFSNLWAHLWFKCPSLSQLVEFILVHGAFQTSSHQWNILSSAEIVSCSLCVASVADICVNIRQHGIDGITDCIYLSVSPSRLWASWGQRPWLHHLYIPGIQLRTSYIFNKHYLKEWIMRGAVISSAPVSEKRSKDLLLQKYPRFQKISGSWGPRWPQGEFQGYS